MKKRYFLYVIIIIGYTIGAQYLLNVLQRNAAATFKPAWYILSGYMVYLILGAILGIEHILNNLKKEGPWQLRYEKLLVVGLPVLILSCFVPLYFWCYRWLPLPVVGLNQEFAHVNSLILGYIAATSFYKKNSPT